MAPRCYSRLLLQPFRGTSQTIDVPGGEAETTDGVHWILYVMDDRIVTHTGLSEVRYGTWNPYQGLARSRVRGTARDSLIEETGERLVEALESCAGRVPFPRADHQECWLLAGDDRRPLVLLETALDRSARSVPDKPRWRPGAAELNEFASPRGTAQQLAETLAEAAGQRPQGMWCERQADGSRLTDGGESVPAEAFPPLVLSEAWPVADVRLLVRDLLAWQAPWLLQLPHLAVATRRWLEIAAWERPAVAARCWRLFPELLDAAGLRVARVKAMLAGADSPLEQPAEPFYPFVNE